MSGAYGSRAYGGGARTLVSSDLAAPAVTHDGAAALAGGSTLTAAGTTAVGGAAALTSTSSLAAGATVEQFAAAPLVSASALVAEATVQSNVVNMTATSTLAAESVVTALASAPLVGTSTLGAAGFVTTYGAAALVGTSILTVRAKAHPVVPTLDASAGIREVLLQWTTSSSATGYRLRRAGVVIYDGAATSFNNTGLANGTQYDYTVTAYNLHNESPTSAVVLATTAVPPSAPTGFTVIGECDQVSMSWTAVALWAIGDNFDRADGPVGATSNGGVPWQ